mmetsp:Transcript_43263/g.55585  ORF Transcript_43263/g.55585 Transcript_43263/m.55585 type:complete len:380 (+) Transcript_43263:201-1340(+)
MTERISFISTLIQFIAVCLVQLLMLIQAGITYLLMRRKFKNYIPPKGLVPLDNKTFLKNKLVSIIIPAYNEENNIEKTLKTLVNRCSDPINLEIIIVDAGCTDNTMMIVKKMSEYIKEKHGICIRYDIKAKGGRGPTLNAGSLIARGNILLFLHADTLLPIGYDDVLRYELKNENVLATAFRFKVSKSSTQVVGVGVMEASVYFRSRVYELPFGDQAIAMTRQRYDSIGGFPNEPIMEDFELVQKLRRAGAGGAGYIKTLMAPAECNIRRWEKYGIARTNLTNQFVMIAYVYGGYSPSDIYHFYYHFNLKNYIEDWYYKQQLKWFWGEEIYDDIRGTTITTSTSTSSKNVNTNSENCDDMIQNKKEMSWETINETTCSK